MANNTSVPSNASVGSCESLQTHYSVPLAIISSMCLVLGLLLILLGYRWFRATFCVAGFVWVALPCFLCLAHFTHLPLYADLSISVGGGLTAALLAVLLPHIGVALCGLSTGALAGLLLSAMLGLLNVEVIWVPGLLLSVLAFSAAAIALRFQKALIVLGSSALGSALFCASADYFLENWHTVRYLWARVLGASAFTPCWWGWLLLACVLALLLVAVLVQVKLTARGTDYRPAMMPRARRRGFQKVEMRDSLDPRHQECSPPPQADFASTRYRHLYKIRRSNGDVISQQYIQCVQHKLSPALRSMTSLNSPPSSHASAERNQSTGVSSLTTVTHIPEVTEEENP